MRIVILAAGVGSRLGSPAPKPLTMLADGRSIMERQLANLAQHFESSAVSTVVGYKKDLIMEAFPDVSYVYNENYGETNTSKSLLKALRLTGHEAVLWLNGDVVFEPELLGLLTPSIVADRSFVAVNTSSVGDEEVKYTIDENSHVAALSKSVVGARGEAVGINFVSSADKPYLIEHLEDCDDHDYFERGLELAIQKDGRKFGVVDVSGALCIEVDFEDDLARANQQIR